ncbi:PREDICTED: uncharacterized protein LOC105557094 [Vollenhovia emeryi]|uniref:uncharacterized protein LOC105557094 n=1 Tax=Vollenhovia emeryi TaxID=411798 RepID=UPI0005F4E1A0|nr:PREDICTED: uncharacterized protein LOC105557094 [Vollenhovia emeryi]
MRQKAAQLTSLVATANNQIDVAQGTIPPGVATSRKTYYKERFNRRGSGYDTPRRCHLEESVATSSKELPSQLKLTALDAASVRTVTHLNIDSERFSNIVSKFDFRIAYSCHHPLGRFIKTGKDNLDKLAHSDVVYQIPCKDCDATYVGQTKRQLGTRVKKHYNDIKRNPASPSVISCHRMDASREFDWESVAILDEEPSYHKRLISEKIHIKRQVNSLNKQSDTELLSEEYLPILNLLPPK